MSGRRTAGGVKWHRVITEAEKERLRYYSYDKRKMLAVAKDMGLKPDPDWLKLARWFANTF